MRKMRISEAVGRIDRNYISEAAAYQGEIKSVYRPVLIKWGAVAACFALVAVIGIGVFRGGLSGGDNAVTLKSGDTIRFVQSDSAVKQPDLAFEISTRALTADETANIFGDLPVTALALFDRENDRVLGIEGKYDGMKLTVSAPGIALNDAVVEGKEETSHVNGTSVHAGYFKNRANVIYYASFSLGDNTVYIEHAGPIDDSEAVKNEIAEAIQKLTSLKQIDIASIRK